MKSQSQSYPMTSGSLSEPHSHHNQTSQPHQQTLKKKKYKVFVTGLSSEMNRKGLINFFKSIYPSTISFISKGFGSQKKKISGYGFLLVGCKGDLNAILKQKLFYYKCRYLKAEPYLKDKGLQTHMEHLESRRVFVGQIPQAMDSGYLWRVLEERVGAVESAYAVINTKRHKKMHKGFGYAIFASAELL